MEDGGGAAVSAVKTNHFSKTHQVKRSLLSSPNSDDNRANKQQKNDPHSEETSSALLVLNQSKLRDDKTKKINSNLVNQIIERDLPENSVINCVLTKNDNLLIFLKSSEFYNEIIDNKIKFNECEIVVIESSKHNDDKSEFKAVIKNTSVNLCNEYKEELQELGVIKIEQLKSIKKNVQPNHTIFTFDSHESCLSLIQSGIVMEYYRRRIVPYNKPVRVIRCHNCQAYDHLTKHCKKERKCIVCSEFHADSENNPEFKCPNTAKKCANCGGEHTANYGGCQSYRDALNKRIAVQNRKKTEQIQDLSLENSQKVKSIEEKQEQILKQNTEILHSIKSFQSELSNIKQEFSNYKKSLAFNIIDFYSILKYEIETNTNQSNNLAVLVSMVSGSNIDIKQVTERINQTRNKISTSKKSSPVKLTTDHV
jgi:hypothetical protein